MDQNKVLLTAEEAAQRFFNGKRSAWSLLQDAKKKRAPQPAYRQPRVLRAQFAQSLHRATTAKQPYHGGDHR